MEYAQKKFPTLPPDKISKYNQQCQSEEEAVSLLGILYDTGQKTYIQLDTDSREGKMSEQERLTEFYKHMKNKYSTILSDEAIRIIIEDSDFNFKKSIENTEKLINSYKQIKFERNPKITNLFKRINEITNRMNIDELTFIIKINGSKIRTTLISFQHYKRLRDLVDKFLSDNEKFFPDELNENSKLIINHHMSNIKLNVKYSPEAELSDDEWDVWGDGNDSDDDDSEFVSILNPLNRLKYLFPMFNDDEVENVYQYEAKKNYGVAYRILQQKRVAFAMAMEFPSATDEEIKDAIEKAKGDEQKVEKIILLNKIENPVIEESLLALRPELTIQQAKEVIQQAKNPNDHRELLQIANVIFPPQKDLKAEKSEPIKKVVHEDELIENEKKKKLDLFSKALNLDVKISSKNDQSDSSAPSFNIEFQKQDKNDADTSKSQQKSLQIPLNKRKNISVRAYGPTLTLDLHGMRKVECEWFIESVLKANKSSRYSKINFITGKGKHSHNKVPILRPLVMEICERRGLKAQLLQENDGVVQVLLD